MSVDISSPPCDDDLEEVELLSLPRGPAADLFTAWGISPHVPRAVRDKAHTQSKHAHGLDSQCLFTRTCATANVTAGGTVYEADATHITVSTYHLPHAFDDAVHYEHHNLMTRPLVGGQHRFDCSSCSARKFLTLEAAVQLPTGTAEVRQHLLRKICPCLCLDLRSTWSRPGVYGHMSHWLVLFRSMEVNVTSVRMTCIALSHP